MPIISDQHGKIFIHALNLNQIIYYFTNAVKQRKLDAFVIQPRSDQLLYSKNGTQDRLIQLPRNAIYIRMGTVNDQQTSARRFVPV